MLVKLSKNSQAGSNMDPFDDDLVLDEILEDFDCLEDVLDAAMDSPTDFDEYEMNADDCAP